jgi:hypothetical protein
LNRSMRRSAPSLAPRQSQPGTRQGLNHQGRPEEPGGGVGTLDGTDPR